MRTLDNVGDIAALVRHLYPDGRESPYSLEMWHASSDGGTLAISLVSGRIFDADGHSRGDICATIAERECGGDYGGVTEWLQLGGWFEGASVGASDVQLVKLLPVPESMMPNDIVLNALASSTDVESKGKPYIAYYREWSGAVVIAVVYYPTVQGEVVRWMTWSGTGWRAGLPRYATGLPLYRLRDLLADPSAEVLVFGDEGAADIAAALLPADEFEPWAVAVAAFGGAPETATDWQPLSDRIVRVVRTEDDPRRATRAAFHARAAGASDVEVVPATALPARIAVAVNGAAEVRDIARRASATAGSIVALQALYGGEIEGDPAYQVIGDEQ